MMNSENIIRAAEILFKHKLNKTGLIDFDTKFKPLNIEDAYKIQEELKILYLSLKNNESLGKKIGVTNKEAGKQVGIDEPFYGNLFTKFSEINTNYLNSKNFYKPYIEPEIGFRIKEDININEYPFKKDNINELIDGIVCAIEIVDFRFSQPIDKIGPYNLIATNGASDYWLRHKNIYSLNKVDLDNHEISVSINSSIVEKGNSKNVLQNPINAALWLINTLASKGEPMLKGQFISTGSCTKAILLKKDYKVKADFGSLGCIEFEYK